MIKINVLGNDMVSENFSNFDAFLACKNLSKTELLNKVLNSNSVFQYEVARKLQFFQYNEIRDIIKNILLVSRYSRHREIAVFILGQMQVQLNDVELNEILSILVYSICHDKGISVKSSAIFSLGHLFRHYNLGEKAFYEIEKDINLIWDINRYSIILAVAFSSAYFPHRNYIKKYLIKNLNSKKSQIISWILYSLREKHYKSKSIELLLINRLNQTNINSYIYSEIIAFLISINSVKVIPYIENMLLTQNRVDNEIYLALKNNSSKNLTKLRKMMLEKFE